MSDIPSPRYRIRALSFGWEIFDYHDPHCSRVEYFRMLDYGNDWIATMRAAAEVADRMNEKVES